MRLTKISAKGLKAHDRDFNLDAPVTAIVGENAAGKSSLAEVVHLLVWGRCPGVDATPDGVMSLARGGKEISIRAEATLDDGRVERVTRQWAREKDGSVSQAITTKLGPKGGSLAQQKAYLSNLFGGLLPPTKESDAWDASEFLKLSPAKMRTRLLRLLPATELTTEKIVPAGCPHWAKPQHTDLTPDEWVQFAIAKAGEQIELARSTLASSKEKIAEDIGDAWNGSEPIEPLQAKLAAHRADYRNLRERDLAQRRVDTAKAELDKAKAEAGADAMPIKDAQAEQDRVSELVRTVRSTLKDANARIERLNYEHTGITRGLQSPQMKDVEACEQSEVDTAKKELDQFVEEKGKIDAIIEQLKGDLEGYDTPRVTECPHCGGNLAEVWASKRAEIETQLGDRMSELEMLEGVVREAKSLVAVRTDGLNKRRLSADLLRIESEIKTAQEEIDALPKDNGSSISAARLDEMERKARHQFDDAVAKSNATSAVARLEERLKLMESELDVVPEVKRTEQEIERDIKDVERQIAELGAKNERSKQYENAKADIESGERRIEELKGWLAKFQSLQTEIVKRTKGWIEERLSSVVAADVRVELFDARQKPDCRFTVDGIDIGTLNTGRLMTFMAALVVVIASTCDAQWKPIVLDGFERVSKANREAFLRSVLEAVEGGVLSQAIVLGCPDTMPTIDGINVIDLSGETNAKRGAA